MKASVNATTGTTSLKLRFLPFVTLLSFQRPKVVSYTKGSTFFFGWWRPKQQKHQCTFELPIDGGLLSLSSNHDDDDEDDDDRGCLMFQAIMEKESKSAAPLSIKRRRKKKNRMVDEEQEQEQEEQLIIRQPENPRAICKLRSELQNYSPWIAGTKSSPIPKFQKWMYLYSQSLVHGYVMWRFHQTWQDRIQKVC